MDPEAVVKLVAAAFQLPLDARLAKLVGEVASKGWGVEVVREKLAELYPRANTCHRRVVVEKVLRAGYMCGRSAVWSFSMQGQGSKEAIEATKSLVAADVASLERWWSWYCDVPMADLG